MPLFAQGQNSSKAQHSIQVRPASSDNETLRAPDSPATTTSRDSAQTLTGVGYFNSESDLTVRECLRLYRKAIIWSALMTLAVVMEGYDGSILSSLFAFPPFQKKFGERVGDDAYGISAAWQGGLANSSIVSALVGMFLSGHVTERFGFRKVMIFCMVVGAALISLKVFASSIAILFVSRLLIGIPMGMMDPIVAIFASEMLPVQLRAEASTFMKLSGVIGSLMAIGMFRAMLFAFRDDPYNEWGFRIVFSLLWVFPIPIIVVCFFVPESPWWLVRKGKVDDARRALQRLRSPGSGVDDTLNMILATNAHEKAAAPQVEGEKEGTATTTAMANNNDNTPIIGNNGDDTGSRYKDCFRGANLRRTEICCVAWMARILCGMPLIGFSTVFLDSTEFSSADAFNVSLVRQSLGVVGVLVSWVLLARLGRRTIYLWGLSAMLVVLLAFGGLSFLDDADGNPFPQLWGYAGLIVVFKFAYDCTVGPVSYALVAEMPATRLRQKTVVVARLPAVAATVAVDMCVPYMLSPTAWNWGARSAFFFAATAALCLVWVYFRLPEPRGRSYGELDLLFENAVRARDFARTNVSTLDVVPTQNAAARGTQSSSDGRNRTSSFREDFSSAARRDESAAENRERR